MSLRGCFSLTSVTHLGLLLATASPTLSCKSNSEATSEQGNRDEADNERDDEADEPSEQNNDEGAAKSDAAAEASSSDEPSEPGGLEPGAEAGTAGGRTVTPSFRQDPNATLEELGVPEGQFVHEIMVIANQPEPVVYSELSTRRFLNNVELPSWLSYRGGDTSAEVTVTPTAGGLARGAYYVVLPTRQELGDGTVNLDASDPAPTHLVIRVQGIGFLAGPIVVQHYTGDEDDFCRVPIAGEAGVPWRLRGAPDGLFVDEIAGDSLTHLELKCDLDAWEEGASKHVVQLENDLGDVAETNLHLIAQRPRLVPFTNYRVLYVLDGASQLETHTYLDTDRLLAAEWSAAASEPWVSVEPQSGTTRTPIRIAVNPEGLATGIHKAQVEFTGAGHISTKVDVIFYNDPAGPLTWTLPETGRLMTGTPAMFSQSTRGELAVIDVLTGERRAVADPRSEELDRGVTPSFSEDGARMYLGVMTEPRTGDLSYDEPRSAKLWTYSMPQLEVLAELDYMDLNGGEGEGVKVRSVGGVDHSWQQENLQGAKSINLQDGRWGFIQFDTVPGFDVIYDDGETIVGFNGALERPGRHTTGHIARGVGSYCGTFFGAETFECQLEDGTPYIVGVAELRDQGVFALTNGYVLVTGSATHLVHPDGFITEIDNPGIGREAVQVSETLFVQDTQVMAVGYLSPSP